MQPAPPRAAPRHLAVIPDGNRRWARARGLSVAEGHTRGVENIGLIADAAFAAGVEVFSVWWGSPANLTRRSADEVATITGVLDDWLARRAPELLRRSDARFDVFGRWEALCPSIAPGVAAARASAGAGPRRFVLLMAYDGREELVAAAASGPQTSDALASRLWTASLPPVDLVLRTGGDPHLSAGFLLWHIADAQLAFVDEPWPAFDVAALTRVLDRHAATERRFGA
jgi:undecaprenyl diphosphate synthase